MDLVYFDTITVGTAQDWAGAAFYDQSSKISDLPLDYIIKSATLIVEMEAVTDIDIAFSCVVYQGDQLTIADDDSITDLLESGDNYSARITWLPDNIIAFISPYMYNAAENWQAHTQDTNMFVSKDSWLNFAMHFEDAIGGDSNPTTVGEIDVYLILEVEIL